MAISRRRMMQGVVTAVAFMSGGLIQTFSWSGALAQPADPPSGARHDDIAGFVLEMTGRPARVSGRVRLTMPDSFPTGYTVPLDLTVDSPQTEAEYVRSVRIFAPRNPIVEIVRFAFFPGEGPAQVSTRIRLSEPQYVVVVAELSDGELLMNSVFVSVATNGCS